MQCDVVEDDDVEGRDSQSGHAGRMRWVKIEPNPTVCRRMQNAEHG